MFLTVESRTPPSTGQSPDRSARLAPLLLELPVCSKYIDCSLWKFQGAPRFLGLGVPTATHGTLERNAGRHGWLSVGVAFKINQAPRQGIKELRPASVRQARRQGTRGSGGRWWHLRPPLLPPF